MLRESNELGEEEGYKLQDETDQRKERKTKEVQKEELTRKRRIQEKRSRKNESREKRSIEGNRNACHQGRTALLVWL